MTTYTNPTGTFDATDGADTFVFNTTPSGIITFHALGGSDSLTVQFANPNPLGFDVADVSNTGQLRVMISGGLNDPRIFGYELEHVDLHGTAGDDTFNLTLGSSTSGLTVSMDGGAGQDYLLLDWSLMAAGLSFIVNGPAITSSYGSFSSFERFWIRSGSGNDTITTAGAEDNINSGNGNDTLSSGAGNDWVSGSGGNDTINGAAGDDTLSGGAGDDIVNGGDGNDSITGDESQISSPGDGHDQLSGGAGNDMIYGGGGDDTLNGGSDNDTLTGGRGADHIDGGDGNDFIYGFGEYGYGPTTDSAADVLIGGAGNDRIDAGYGDSVDGGTGIDQLVFNGFDATVGITANFAQLANGGTINIGGATLTGIEYVINIGGSDFNDVLVAGPVAGIEGITLDGWGGDDDLTGSSGVDSIYGGDGNDIIRGGVGLNPNTSPSGDRLNGEGGNDTIYIGADGAYAFGGSGNDVVFGGSAYDEIWGEAGDDSLNGGGGNDGINGGDGNDWVTGGAGQDTMYGGGGSDTFLDTVAGFNGDTINDFLAGDRIIISNANFSTFSFNLTGNLLTYTGGSLTFGSPIAGTLVASAAPGGGVMLQIQLPPAGTNDQIANYLTSGYWDGDVHRWNVSPGGTITVDISTLSANEQNVARLALQQWTDITGIHFQEVSFGAQISFDSGEEPGGPSAYTEADWSNGFLSSAQVHISTSWLTNNGSYIGSYGFQTYVHEIGHALGLGHSGDYNFNADYPNDATFLNDSWATSVMSYFSQRDNTYFYDQNFSELSVATPMVADILAAQQLYGLSTNTRAGNTTYGYNSNAGSIFDADGPFPAAFTIFDTGGIDTLDYSNAGSPQTINLNPETFSSVDGYRGNLTIARGTVIENAIGASSIDVIIGNSADNVLTGNGGADYLTGGAGRDTFRDSAGSFWGDTITDFGADDRIVITDATFAGFTFDLVGNELHFTGGYLTLGTVPDGTIVARAAPGGGVELAIGTNDARHDLNGDGRSDVLWRNEAGSLSEWLAQPGGTFAYNGNAAYQLPTNWQVTAIADFNGDGRDDVMWRNEVGALSEWLAQPGGTFAYNGNAAYQLPTNWELAVTGDFNGDNRDDILWRNETGNLSEWLGQVDGTFAYNPNAAYQLDTGWQIVGAGDFNGDTRDDLMWMNGAGVMMEWLGQSGGSFAWNPNFNMQVAIGWQFAAIGDFNGDGVDDMLWRHSSGSTAEWLAQPNGSFAQNPYGGYQIGTDWQIATIGDFNGDGRDDILWRNGSGTMTQWLADAGGAFSVNANAAYQLSTNWQMQPVDQLF